MLKLEATLIATTAARPWRIGWSLDRAVDFIVRAPMPPAVATPPDVGRVAAREPVSFLDADDILPGTTVVRRYVSLAAGSAGAAPGERPEPPLARAWSSVSRKVAGS